MSKTKSNENKVVGALKGFAGMFKRSALELNDIRCIAVTGILIAVFLLLRTIGNIDFGPTLRVNFSFLALASIGMLYGPVVAMLAAIPCDILGFALDGTGASFIPGFTFILMFNGLIYGVFLYGFDAKKTISIDTLRLIVAQTIIIFISRLVLNTYLLYRVGFIGGNEETVRALITARVVTNLIRYPVDITMMIMMLIPIKAAYSRIIVGGRQTN
ncbi:MAG: folate family ECF transporter S component [Oscillospiraceae bacterium]|nr:folate family ECF transporter S component [Oscillospiraceae bacterium]